MATVLTEYPVVSDKLRYSLRPIAVESKCHIIQCPALGTNLNEGSTALSIVFRIQHNPSGRFMDPTTCKFKMQFLLQPVYMPCDTFFLKCGPESIICCLQVKTI